MIDLSDPISRQQTIAALRALSDEDGYINTPHEVVTDVVRGLPPVRAEHEQTTQSEQGDSDKFGVKISETCEDCISRQAAISAICNACGKIDCDKMDKCEKLQLPPANCSEFPNNSDTISRQAAKEAVRMVVKDLPTRTEINILINDLPSAEPERKTGKWILVHPIQSDDSGAYMCSKCKTAMWEIRPSSYHFCPNCGERMVKEKK